MKRYLLPDFWMVCTWSTNRKYRKVLDHLMLYRLEAVVWKRFFYGSGSQRKLRSTGGMCCEYLVNIVVLVIIAIATINIRLAIIIAIIAITKVYFFSSRLLLLAFTHGHYQLHRWIRCRLLTQSSCPDYV